MSLLLIIPLALSLFFSGVHGQSCAGYRFPGNADFLSCTDLPYLNSFIHWNYNRSSNTARIAYRHAGGSSDRWTSWALNPTGTGMAGAQALVAYQRSDGSMAVYRSPVSGYNTALQPGELSFRVSNLSASFVGKEIIIFATLRLDTLSSTVNHVWQEGPLSGGSPARHPVSGPNMQSMGTLNFLSGQTTPSGGGAGVNSRQRERNIHGVLNAVGWGVLIPIGAIIARYLKVFDCAVPAWFYLHISCQVSGYIIGVAGWATGLRLGAQSPGVSYAAHRAIGIAIFCLATLQLSALLLRPKKDHKYRLYWSVYHHSVGYAIILLSIINIFQGFNILNPEHKWRRAYVAIIVILAVVAAVLEVYTWMVVISRRKEKEKQNQPGQHKNENNGFNTYRI